MVLSVLVRPAATGALHGDCCVLVQPRRDRVPRVQDRSCFFEGPDGVEQTLPLLLGHGVIEDGAGQGTAFGLSSHLAATSSTFGVLVIRVDEARVVHVGAAVLVLVKVLEGGICLGLFAALREKTENRSDVYTPGTAFRCKKGTRINWNQGSRHLLGGEHVL